MQKLARALRQNIRYPLIMTPIYYYNILRWHHSFTLIISCSVFLLAVIVFCFQMSPMCFLRTNEIDEVSCPIFVPLCSECLILHVLYPIFLSKRLCQGSNHCLYRSSVCKASTKPPDHQVLATAAKLICRFNFATKI